MEDRLRTWGNAAATQYSADGITDGCDSDLSEEESAEQRYMRVRPMQRRGERESADAPLEESFKQKHMRVGPMHA